MLRISGFITILTILLFGTTLRAQTSRQRVTTNLNASNASCSLAGVYRIDVLESDKLYSVVRGATGKVPFSEQQKFFMDLSVRLTPPDMLAFECRGSRVTVGSSRSPRVTFMADGKNRTERTPEGYLVRSRIGLENNTLTFTSDGKAEDNVSVTFQSVENGQRMRVTRHIYAEQLSEPIIIQSVYNKISDTVAWDSYGEAQIAKQRAEADENIAQPVAEPRVSSERRQSGDAGQLRNALNEWIDATNERNIEKQMVFYMPELKAFYLTRDVPSSAVRREKTRVFTAARSVDIRAEEPEIIFQNAGRTAIMRFRKKYSMTERARTRSGEVIQELRWQRTDDGWRIFSERDIRVIR